MQNNGSPPLIKDMCTQKGKPLGVYIYEKKKLKESMDSLRKKNEEIIKYQEMEIYKHMLLTDDDLFS